MKDFDNAYRNKHNVKLIAGVDEAGRGPLAGPLVVCACIMPEKTSFNLNKDSKGLTLKQRNYYKELIYNEALAISIDVINNDKIDEINILNATIIGMENAINNLNIKPEFVLTDYVKIHSNIKYEAITKGDIKSFNIACASIIAKTYRDNLMEQFDKEYPIYDFKQNKGYPTKKHKEIIKEHGLSSIHRKTFNYKIK